MGQIMLFLSLKVVSLCTSNSDGVTKRAFLSGHECIPKSAVQASYT